MTYRGVNAFLGITESMFRAFKTARCEPGGLEEHYFDVWDERRMSLVLAKHDELISYGAMRATDRLLHTVHTWVDLGMPTAASFALAVHRSDRALTTRKTQ